MISSKYSFAVKRHFVTICVVILLCWWYYFKTNRWQVWLFLPISLLPILITWLHFTNIEKEEKQGQNPTIDNKK